MIVFDLKCTREDHRFEGWFGSGEDYESQRQRGLLVCPVCGDNAVEKAAMAPAVPAKGNQRPQGVVQVREEAGQGDAAVPMSMGMNPEKAAQLLQALADAQASALANSQWVGRGFADQARAMHYGEEDYKAIHGEVAPQEARDLIEEGVEVSPLLFPVIPPDAHN